MKILKRIIFLIVSFFVISSVNAESYVDKFLEFSQWIPNTYIIQQKGTEKRYQQMSVIKRVSDGSWAYCIEPGISMTTAYMTGYDYDQALLSGISDSDWDRIVLLSYYGYNYTSDGYDHRDLKFYAITQMMIWRTVNNGYDIYFTSTLNGSRITRYESEMQEIENLISEHYKRPSFANQSLNMNLNESIVLNDTNNVLSKFNIVSNDGLIVSKNGNELTLTTSQVGTSTVRLEKKDTKYSSLPIAYVSSNYQNIMVVGDYDPIRINLNINVINAKIKVVKVDAETNETIKMTGIQFKIKNLDTNEYICDDESCIFETDANGSFITNYLKIGNYQLEELDQKINGYLWNSIPLKFSIDENSNIDYDNELGAIITLRFSNKQVTGNIYIEKIGEELVIEDGKFEYIEIPLSNVILGLYDENFNLITKVTTINGFAKFSNLNLGIYYIKELSTVNNHLIDNTFYRIELKYEDQYNSIIIETFKLKNYLPKGILEFTKEGSTSELLPNTLIEIYLLEEENKTLIFFGRTDENGSIIIDNLPVGKYSIIEKEAPLHYILNDEEMYFEILEDGEIIQTTMTNEKMPVSIPNTGTDSKISYLLSLGIILGGLGFILYDKKKKK